MPDVPTRSDVIWQQVEGALAMSAAFGFYITVIAIFPWWAAVLIFFAPDLAFAAYLAGPKIGALAYNTVHNYGVCGGIAFVGYATGAPILFALGLLWIAHCGFDRMLGYGLKRPDAFTSTHMGQIGKPPKR